MAATETGLFKVGDTVRVYFAWLDVDGDPLTSLSPAPTLERVAPDGTKTTGIALTQLGSTEYFYYDLVGALGLYGLTGTCSDTDCATARTEQVAVLFSAASLDDLSDALATLNATATIVSPVREVGGEYVITVKQGETMSSALGNAIELEFTGVPDSTGCTPVLTFVDKNGKLLSEITGNPFSGTLGSWSAGAVTATWELTAAQTALFPVSKSNQTDLEKMIRFEAKLTGYASSGVLKPVMPTVGDVEVYTGAWTA